MITYKQGNLLEDKAEALVNTVNLQGVMGKGIALAFSVQMPDIIQPYKAACKSGELSIGHLQILSSTLNNRKVKVINFPTKTNWRKPSEIEYILLGLRDLVNVLRENDIESVALPPLGAGNGGLDWKDVKSLIEKELAGLPIQINVYEPLPGLNPVIQGKIVNLTPGRAMLLHLLRAYRAQPVQPDADKLVVQKLCYFMERLGEPMRANFKRGTFGPYSHGIEKMIVQMDGSYLQGEGALADQKRFGLLWVKPEAEMEIKKTLTSSLRIDQSDRLDKLMRFIEGFESPFWLEALSSVDWLIQNNLYSKDDIALEVLPDIKQWNRRKAQLFTYPYIQVCVQHLVEFGFYS